MLAPYLKLPDYWPQIAKDQYFSVLNFLREHSELLEDAHRHRIAYGLADHLYSELRDIEIVVCLQHKAVETAAKN